ncbi:Uu.00g018400.m01.CDS01 [Anthostomella pinea]|uniref:Uu.00g018400.m01.CDS01 n=1 Tax=Anthostomella pinea TaxID=933095 RepID=A0AAI8VT94_9PEZI|nr:Uu.00g018400.m01.CDS01 [Anthostomella pinea]
MSASRHRAQLIQHCAEAARAIRDECTAIRSAEEVEAVSLAGCGHALVELLSRQAQQISLCYRELESTTATANVVGPISREKRALVLKRLEDIASIAYAKFYAYLFKDLPVCWRQLYTDASILKFCFVLLRSSFLAAPGTELEDADGAAGRDAEDLDALVETLDLALILAGAAGESRGRRWIDKALELLRLVWLETAESNDSGSDAAILGGRPAKRVKLADTLADNVRGGIHHDETFSTEEPFTPPVKHPIKRVEALSMEAFQTHMDRPQDPKLGPEPLVIRNALKDWPALSTHPWNKPSYLLSQTFDGRRLVPVEIGRSYVDEDWGQKIIHFGEFLRTYIDPSLPPISLFPTSPHLNPNFLTDSDPNPISDTTAPSSSSPQVPKQTAYLAQHPLLTQLPALRNDILIPDYCYTSPPLHPTDPAADQPELEAPLLNTWFGPPGTITPLHTDPYHNILAQAVGRKYVRLYAPTQTARMAARGREGGVEMGNTSRVDVGVVEGWDEARGGGYDGVDEGEDGAGDEDMDMNMDDEEGKMSEQDIAAFREIPFVDCILEPGDALYIPIGWWHYVRGLSVSFSVSFWWN